VVPLIDQIAEHIISGGGKRLRPTLVVLAARACELQGDAHVEAAAFIEFIHTATLLHDDVVDGSSLRRGRDTANRVFGNQASVLVGDFVYSRAFQMMAALGRQPDGHGGALTSRRGRVLQLMNARSGYQEERYRRSSTARPRSFEPAPKSRRCGERPRGGAPPLAAYGRHPHRLAGR
jgi:octaprenyl-diphosphate synthase